MKELISLNDYAALIQAALPKGILLNTNGDKFNSMVIGWGHLGIIWGMETFTVYVRQSRYTKAQLDKTKEFTLSVPLDNNFDKEIIRICGTLSGNDINKADYVTLVDPKTNHTPGIKEYPLTLECEIIYQQDQVLEKMPETVLERYYGKEDDIGNFHTLYIGKIVDAYIIRED